MDTEHLIAIASIVTMSIVVLLTYFFVFRYVTAMYNFDFNADSVFLKHLKVVSVLVGLSFCIGFPTYVVMRELDTSIMFTLGLPISIAIGLLIVSQFIILRVYNEQVRFHYEISHNATEPILEDFNEDIEKIWTRQTRILNMDFILVLYLVLIYTLYNPDLDLSTKFYYLLLGLLVYFHQTLTVFSLKESKILMLMAKSQIEKDTKEQ